MAGLGVWCACGAPGREECGLTWMVRGTTGSSFSASRSSIPTDALSFCHRFSSTASSSPAPAREGAQAGRARDKEAERFHADEGRKGKGVHREGRDTDVPLQYGHCRRRSRGRKSPGRGRGKESCREEGRNKACRRGRGKSGLRGAAKAGGHKSHCERMRYSRVEHCQCSLLIPLCKNTIPHGGMFSQHFPDFTVDGRSTIDCHDGGMSPHHAAKDKAHLSDAFGREPAPQLWPRSARQLDLPLHKQRHVRDHHQARSSCCLDDATTRRYLSFEAPRCHQANSVRAYPAFTDRHRRTPFFPFPRDPSTYAQSRPHL